MGVAGDGGVILEGEWAGGGGRRKDVMMTDDATFTCIMPVPHMLLNNMR